LPWNCVGLFGGLPSFRVTCGGRIFKVSVGRGREESREKKYGHYGYEGADRDKRPFHTAMCFPSVFTDNDLFFVYG
jgi:hypothetical protein